ncbi:flagellar export chaperone FliS [Paludibaculum fermentans]|uniref:flagellar export chaperone FliS n=1 Tax=Paludibaculum fermentans TaxID=1473598 RepID=UPI003EC12D86
MRNFVGTDSEYIESRVLSATPAGLIEILYEKALEHMASAQFHLRAGEVVERGQAISKVQAIINELLHSLDTKKGGEIALNLQRLYEYSVLKLTEAHRFGTEAGLVEVERILQNMLDGWREATRPAQNTSSYDSVTADHMLLQPEAAPALRSWTL